MIRLNRSALGPGDADGVRTALQNAIQLEHSTIPLYLYALYSINRVKNATIYGIIQSVAIEEMLHMTLVCNILNALGGNPIIDNPAFVPTYNGGPLPGGVEGDLKVHLAPFSRKQLETFMKIEEPEDPLNFPVAGMGVEPLTIGQFYQAIKQQIAALNASEFSPGPRNQIGPDLMPNSIVVINAQTAAAAIDVIVEQGEGTSQSPKQVVGGEDYAHYYRFAEIYHGKKLISNPQADENTPPDQRYRYGGAPVNFDASGIFPAPTDPKAADHAAGTETRREVDEFNFAYTQILKKLQAAVSGQPEEIDNAIGLMDLVKQKAVQIFQANASGRPPVGPSFEYQDVEPV